MFFDSNWLHLYSLDLSTELIFTNPHRFIFFQNVHYQNSSALHFLTKSFQISFQCFHCHRIFNKSSTANYFLTCRLNNQSWIKSICNYQIAKVEISIKSKSVKFFIFKFYHWQLRHQEQQLIYSPFFKNHTNFYFVRLTFSCAAEHVRAPMRLPWRYIFRFNLWEYNRETENMQWELHLRSKC